MSNKKTSFLDVDSNILEKNLLITDNANKVNDFENFFRSTENSTEDAPWKLVTPTAGFCLKTADSRGKKVFINICKLDDIPEPKEVSDEELLQIWQSEDATDYRVPISIQEPHDELDKSGNPTVVYDVAVNSNFYNKVYSSTIFRQFVLQVIFEGLEHKYDLELKKDGYVVLKNRRCIGELRPHRIRFQKGPYQPPKRLIEELPTGDKVSGAGDALGPEESKTPTNSGRTPTHRLFQKPDGTFLAEFLLDNLVSEKDIALAVGEDRIVLECRRARYLLDIFVPVNIKESLVTAQFDKDTRILTVTMPTTEGSA